MNGPAFSRCHPAVSFLYFALVLVFSALLLHPLFLAVSLVGALCCVRTLVGGGALARAARFFVPATLFAALVNLAFNHAGATILAYLPTGNPLTLESAAYSVAAAAMLFAVLAWFSCLSAVMTSEKILWLLGRSLPSLALLLSMTLRFAPHLRTRMRETAEARAALGLYRTDGTRLERLRDGVTVFSGVTAWSLEHAAETADSMKSRGWGLRGRTAFSPFCLDGRDKRLLAWLALCGALLAVLCAAGSIGARYYPTLRFTFTPCTGLGATAYLALCLTPVILERREARAWRCSASKS